jgi:transcriptional regulator with XRE-family HTH domain
VGAKLRDARERRGISLRQIAEATKISVGALEALERNDISRLPGGIFTRAFVRSYAAQVGLDPETAIKEFMAEFPQDSVTAGHPLTAQTGDHDTFESDRQVAFAFVKLAAISAPLAVVVLYFATFRHPAPAAPPASPVVTATSDARPAGLSGPTTSSGQGARSAQDRLLTGITALGGSSVWIVVDGQLVLDREMRPGEFQMFDVRTDLILKTSDAAALMVTLNGVEARPLGGQGDAVTVEMNLDNFKTFLRPQ